MHIGTGRLAGFKQCFTGLNSCSIEQHRSYVAIPARGMAREFGELNHLVLPSGNTALPPNDIACFITTYGCPVAIQCIQHIGKINTLFYQTEMYGKLYRLSNTLTGVPKKVCFRHRLHKTPKVSVHFGASGE